METAVTYIEDHLQDNIKVADIAAFVSYSLYHFCRIFNQTVHHAPYDYLIRRRLSAAALQLVDANQRITDIALAYQFGTPEGFSRAFKRMFGELPNQWRKHGLPDPRLLLKPLTAAHLAHRNQATFQQPTFVQKPMLTIVGLMTIAQNITAVTQLQQQLNNPPTHTVYHYPDFWIKNGRPTLTGTVGKIAMPPLVSQTIPAQQYACFALPKDATKRPLLTDYIYQTWLPQSNYQLALPLEIEHKQQLLVPVKPNG